MEEPGQLKRALIDASAGAIAGGISRTVTSPLDVIKIRFQVQLEPTSSWALVRKNLPLQSKYTGMLQATKDIFREEGLPGFWRGNVPALLMVMPYTAIQFTVLHKLKTFASGSSKTEDHINLSPYLSYISGSLAGCAATVGSYPFDLLRTVLASQGEPKIRLSMFIFICTTVCSLHEEVANLDIPSRIMAFWKALRANDVYPTMRSAFVDIVRTRGIRGLYAGLSPTLVEIVPYAGLQFGTYDTFKRWTKALNRLRFSKSGSTGSDDSLTSFQIFLCGLGAGISAKLVCHPLDVVKKRFQIEGLQRHPRYGARVEHRAYRNMFDALERILKSEGWAGFYKGIVPSIVKSAPASAVTFVAYEYTFDLLESIWT
ncbi:hypothetical protein FEM48_Zijuj12G0190300 [Ziziphus jujuba var. spinosa]|uniref:Mitochondrial thiamine diphosphate carrier 2-like n=1 Tax=Ziziphus jujuba var. spinosa TaxID=714518 RepID=A0A978UF03_ZIZJJ|nr:hypothetical protein FEM48_Zijuj12G0190300 [Ziziphus jujuba var. spinosa]